MALADRIEAWAHAQYGADLAQMQQWWTATTHHGCFCGAGAGCDNPVDGLDECCKTHDSAYGSVGVSFETMWHIPDGFTKVRDADQALASCAGGAQTTNDTFRQNLIWLFSNRVRIADALLRWEAFSRWLLSDASSQPTDQRQQQYASLAADLATIGVGNDVLAGALQDHGVTLTDTGDTYIA